MESSKDITLREVTAETVRLITSLSVAAEQTRFVATNAESIAEAYFHPEAWFRAVYSGDTPVGFVMLEDWSRVPNGKPEPISLWRFMIDRQHQGTGIGRRALEIVVEHVRSSSDQNVFLTSYVPGDNGPEGFYRKFGFKDTGKRDGDEVIAELVLRDGA